MVYEKTKEHLKLEKKLEKVRKKIDKTTKKIDLIYKMKNINLGNELISFAEDYNKIMNTDKTKITHTLELPTEGVYYNNKVPKIKLDIKECSQSDTKAKEEGE